VLEVIALVLAALVSGVLLRGARYRLFVVLLLVTEFYYVDFGGGKARVYHFVAIPVVLALVRYVPRLLGSRGFVAVSMFAAVNLVAVLASEAPEAAGASYLSLLANINVALAIALILVAGKVDAPGLKRLILSVTLVSVAWGAVQIAAARFGLDLALSEQQAAQIAIGFGPGFRTEANTFGKYMVVPLLLFLPDYLEGGRARRMALSYAAFLAGMLMNFTRTAIYGVAVAMVFVFLWYLRRRKALRLAAGGMKLAPFAAVGIALALGGLVSVSEYAVHKASNLFSREEVLAGGSSAYRLAMMEIVIDDAFSSAKSTIIGRGWGQTRTEFQGTDVQAGGGDLVNVLGYGGLIGVAAYVGMMLAAFVAAWRTARSSLNPERARLGQGVMFALVGVFMTAQMAGYLIAPEFWLLIGVCIFLGVKERAAPSALRPQGG
jgi:hypothetical protein